MLPRSQPLFKSCTLHNYVHSLGYTLKRGAKTAIEDYMQQNVLAHVLVLQNGDEQLRLPSIPETRHVIQFATTTPPLSAAVSEHLSSITCTLLCHACILAENHGRKQITALDITFLTGFLDNMRQLFAFALAHTREEKLT